MYYDIAGDKWSNLPNLNISRSAHSSCTFSGKYAMVFGGIEHGSKTTLNSIEKLNMHERHDKANAWVLMTFKLSTLPDVQNNRML